MCPHYQIFFIGEINITYDVIDRVSQNYIQETVLTPAKFKHKYVPLMIEPDGNCLLRSLSRLTYGIELRTHGNQVLNSNGFHDKY